MLVRSIATKRLWQSEDFMLEGEKSKKKKEYKRLLKERIENRKPPLRLVPGLVNISVFFFSPTTRLILFSISLHFALTRSVFLTRSLFRISSSFFCFLNDDTMLTAYVRISIFFNALEWNGDEKRLFAPPTNLYENQRLAATVDAATEHAVSMPLATVHFGGTRTSCYAHCPLILSYSLEIVLSWCWKFSNSQTYLSKSFKKILHINLYLNRDADSGRRTVTKAIAKGSLWTGRSVDGLWMYKHNTGIYSSE